MTEVASVWLIGAGVMGEDYIPILNDLKVPFKVIGRSQKTCDVFEKKTGIRPIAGGLEAAMAQGMEVPSHAIVAVSRDQLTSTSLKLIKIGVKNLLVEKPVALSSTELSKLTKHNDCNIVVGFNRRFYSATQKAKELIEKDGGPKSFHFEFTEWAHTLEDIAYEKGDAVAQSWFLGNSIHVADLAFYLGGKPKEISTYSTGANKLNWHTKSSVFSGAGKTKDDVLFSYMANWTAPGRWTVEVLTDNYRFYFKPMEELAIQKKGSVSVEKFEMDYSRDQTFKPGLHLQVENFLTNKLSEFETVGELAELFPVYEKIAGY